MTWRHINLLRSITTIISTSIYVNARVIMYEPHFRGRALQALCLLIVFFSAFAMCNRSLIPLNDPEELNESDDAALLQYVELRICNSTPQ